jgi:hypothetical protein
MRHAAIFGLAAALTVAGCSPRANQTAPARREVVWRQLGSWTGHGSTQTESFTSDTGALRVRWETSPVSSTSRPAGAGTPADPRTGTFRLTAHSAISGRLLQQIVDHPGAGHGVDYVQQDPHVFYVVVESVDLNWRFTVEEAIEYP